MARRILISNGFNRTYESPCQFHMPVLARQVGDASQGLYNVLGPASASLMFDQLFCIRLGPGDFAALQSPADPFDLPLNGRHIRPLGGALSWIARNTRNGGVHGNNQRIVFDSRRTVILIG